MCGRTPHVPYPGGFCSVQTQREGNTMKGFTGLSIDLVIKDGEWKQYITDRETLRHGLISLVGNLPSATALGKPAFQLLVDMDDGTQVIVETTWALMRNA